MGWANCGEDSKGRPIGYAHSARCDHPGCNKRIHRGLAYACGGMHGEDEISCEGYFCDKHRTIVQLLPGHGPTNDLPSLCAECLKLAIEARIIHPDEGYYEDAEGK
jgi:hypothetical protein